MKNSKDVDDAIVLMREANRRIYCGRPGDAAWRLVEAAAALLRDMEIADRRGAFDATRCSLATVLNPVLAAYAAPEGAGVPS